MRQQQGRVLDDIARFSANDDSVAKPRLPPLRLADGSMVEYSEVLTLCSQCHSKQADSFAHGAHGGMNGFWDLTRGTQMKNNCIDCHDPHAPKYPQMIVTFKPKDRFNSAEDSHAHHK